MNLTKFMRLALNRNPSGDRSFYQWVKADYESIRDHRLYAAGNSIERSRNQRQGFEFSLGKWNS